MHFQNDFLYVLYSGFSPFNHKFSISCTNFDHNSFQVPFMYKNKQNIQFPINPSMNPAGFSPQSTVFMKKLLAQL